MDSTLPDLLNEVVRSLGNVFRGVANHNDFGTISQGTFALFVISTILCLIAGKKLIAAITAVMCALCAAGMFYFWYMAT